MAEIRKWKAIFRMAIELTKEELIKFLKENLKLSVETSGPGYYSSSVSHTLRLMLGDEVISETYLDTY